MCVCGITGKIISSKSHISWLVLFPSGISIVSITIFQFLNIHFEFIFNFLLILVCYSVSEFYLLLLNHMGYHFLPISFITRIFYNYIMAYLFIGTVTMYVLPIFKWILQDPQYILINCSVLISTFTIFSGD